MQGKIRKRREMKTPKVRDRASNQQTRVADGRPCRHPVNQDRRIGGKMMRWLFRLLPVAGVAFFTPLLWLWLTVPIVPYQMAKPADAALIFGALVRSGDVSPLHSERLDTGVMLWRDGVVETLVASNAARAAGIMKTYLEEQGVPATAIEVDGLALATPDTCVAEAARDEARQVIMVSQAFHLPRIALQCRRLGVTGQYIEATRANPTAEAPSIWTIIRVRGLRYTREATLIWAELLGQYRRLEQAVSP